MAKDLLYYFSKDTYTRYELGEIQTNFNFGIGIDGSKDSAKVIAYNFNYEEIEPLTIVWHEKTNTWWVVSSDKVERFMNEDSTFIYKHTLQLLGAIELLNARDLTDCGFYQNNYTINQFFFRLLKLSNLEFNNSNFTINLVHNNLIDINKNIDYIKTFENYTLLSAIREFFDGYNFAVKLTFGTQTTNNITTLKTLNFNLISKSGNGVYVNTNVFNDIDENRLFDKNSFATTVISNAENVVSTKSQLFPSVGSIKASGTSGTLSTTNAVIRLPSNIYKLNWLKMIIPAEIYVVAIINGRYYTDDAHTQFSVSINPYVETQQDLLEKVQTAINGTSWSQSIKNQFYLDFRDKLYEVYAGAKKVSTVSLYSGWRYNPIYGNIIPPTDNSDFYLPVVDYHSQFQTSSIYYGMLTIAEKEVRDSLTNPTGCFYYSKGSNIINCANCFNPTLGEIITSVGDFSSTDLREDTKIGIGLYDFPSFDGLGVIFGKTTNRGTPTSHRILNNNLVYSNISFIANYIPMSDIKIKVDNKGYRNDTQLYNQNGKINDSVALSKLINSYSKEIQNGVITKYGYYYDFNSIPKVGNVVSINNENFVISNVSYNFTFNENSEYYISCEFSLNKWVSTKSTLTNPNTNIRDYGIPQKNNVVRKQLYRDFYELDKTADLFADNDKYVSLSNVASLDYVYSKSSNHIAVIKMTFDNAYGGDSSHSVSSSDKYYYQLEAVSFPMKKMIYKVVNFNDNNIIGYGSQDVSCGFDINRVISGMTDTVITPISYVDDDGKAKGIDICFVNAIKLVQVYNKYLTRKGLTYTKPLYNYSVFIDSEIYEGIPATNTYTYNGTSEYTALSSNTYKIDFDLTESETIPTDLNAPASEFTPVISNLSWGSGSPTIMSGIFAPKITKDSSNHYILSFYILMEETAVGNPSFRATIRRNYNKDGALQNCDFLISEPNYNKDPIEVPFFEYSCQLDDSDNVLVGENIFDGTENDKCYIYQYILAPKGTITENNFGTLTLPSLTYGLLLPGGGTFQYDNAIKFEYEGNSKIYISAYQNGSFAVLTNTQTLTNQIDIQHDLDLSNKDLVIIRSTPTKAHYVGPLITSYDYKRDLMFVVKDPSTFTFRQSGEILELVINHYKVN